MVDESLDRFFGFRYRDRAEALNVFNTLFADHFGRVRSNSTSLERFEGIVVFCLIVAWQV